MKRPYTHWNLPMVLEVASSCKTRSEFKRTNSVAYRKAIQWGIIESLFPIEHVVIERIKPVAVRKVVHVVTKPSFNAREINEDVDYILDDPDWENLQYDASRDYEGEALTYYWQRIDMLKRKLSLNNL